MRYASMWPTSCAALTGAASVKVMSSDGILGWTYWDATRLLVEVRGAIRWVLSSVKMGSQKLKSGGEIGWRSQDRGRRSGSRLPVLRGRLRRATRTDSISINIKLC
jgi:hypothetical protein